MTNEILTVCGKEIDILDGGQWRAASPADCAKDIRLMIAELILGGEIICYEYPARNGCTYRW